MKCWYSDKLTSKWSYLQERQSMYVSVEYEQYITILFEKAQGYQQEYTNGYKKITKCF